MSESQELALRPSQSQAIMPIDPQEMAAAQAQHQALVRALLDDSDWQGPPDAPGSFVKKSGWRKIAAGYSLSFEKVEDVVERDAEGKPLRASYTVACIAPNGRRVEATGHCAYAESRFSGPRGNISKLENDIRATAETRAKNRASSDIIGMGKVSAEEVNAGHPDAGPTYGPAAPPTTADKTREAVAYLLTNPDGESVEPGDEIVTALLAELETKFGYMPYVAVYTLARLTAAVRIQFGDEPPEEPVATEAVPEGEGEVIEGEVVAEGAEARREEALEAGVDETVAEAKGGAERVNELAGDVTPAEGTAAPETPDSPPASPADPEPVTSEPAPAPDLPPIGTPQAGDQIEW